MCRYVICDDSIFACGKRYSACGGTIYLLTQMLWSSRQLAMNYMFVSRPIVGTRLAVSEGLAEHFCELVGNGLDHSELICTQFGKLQKSINFKRRLIRGLI